MKTRILLLILNLFCATFSMAQSNWIVYDTTNSPLPNNKTYKVVEDNNGNIWASTQNGLVKYDGMNWTVYDSIPGTTYALKDLFAMVYDHINDWLYVSMPGVLIRFDGTNWNTWPHLAYSNEDVIDSQGRIWMALYNLGVGVFDGVNFTYYDTTNSPIQSPFIYDIVQDNSGIFWILSGPGLTRFDGNSWMVYDTSNSPLPSNSIFGIGVDNNNLLWVHGVTAQNETFIYTFDGNKWNPFDTTICQPVNAYSFIKPDAMNRMWIGTYGAGLQMINLSNCSTYTDLNSPLPTNYLLDIYITSSQTLWMTTQLKGLIKVDLPVGLSEISAEISTQIFPNPTDSKITIRNFSGGNISIHNMIGEEIYATDFKISESQDIDLNISFISPGVYLIKTIKGITKLIVI